MDYSSGVVLTKGFSYQKLRRVCPEEDGRQKPSGEKLAFYFKDLGKSLGFNVPLRWIPGQ